MERPVAAFNRIAETEEIRPQALRKDTEIDEIVVNGISPHPKKRKEERIARRNRPR